MGSCPGWPKPKQGRAKESELKHHAGKKRWRETATVGGKRVMIGWVECTKSIHSCGQAQTAGRKKKSQIYRRYRERGLKGKTENKN